MVKRYGEWVNIFRAMREQMLLYGIKRYVSDLMRRDRSRLKVMQARKQLGIPFVWVLGSPGTFMTTTPELVVKAVEAVSIDVAAHVFYWTGDRLIEKSPEDAKWALSEAMDERKRDSAILAKLEECR
jgi:hypothetical protein